MEEQRLQLSTPSYRLKKEKGELKKSNDTPRKDSDSSSLIVPSSVTVVGAVDGQGMVRVQVPRRKNLTLQIRKVILQNCPNLVKRNLPNRLHPNLTDPQLMLGLMS